MRGLRSIGSHLRHAAAEKQRFALEWSRSQQNAASGSTARADLLLFKTLSRCDPRRTTWMVPCRWPSGLLDYRLQTATTRSAGCQRSGPELWPMRCSHRQGPVPHEDCGKAAMLVDTCHGGTIRARLSQESVSAFHDDTARSVPVRQDGAFGPWTPSVALLSQPAAAFHAANEHSLARIRIGRTLDYVDRIVPAHYSAAPSGDLCTTSKPAFVVQGESRDSVPTTGERPQPLRSSSRVGLFTVGPQSTVGQITVGRIPVGRINVSRVGVPMWRERQAARGGSTAQLMTGAATENVVAMKSAAASWNAAQQHLLTRPTSKASFPPIEQMKHDTSNALALESQALNGRRDGAPRNRFFT